MVGTCGVFHHCITILEVINLKREKVYLGSQFLRLQSMVVGSTVWGPGVCDGAKMLTSWYEETKR